MLTPVMEAINYASEALQDTSTDILSAQLQIDALTAEMLRLRSDAAFCAALADAESLAHQLGIECDLPAARQRKVPRRLDDHASTAAAALSPADQLKINLYLPVIDRSVSELTERFPGQLTNFAFLGPRLFQALDVKQRARRLAKSYELKDVVVSSQWRLTHHLVKPGMSLSVKETYRLLPSTYDELRYLYKVLLTLPVTTASVERCFSKLKIVKAKLRSTMAQSRLEVLLLASIEKDILNNLGNSDLVARFASQGEPRMLLAQ